LERKREREGKGGEAEGKLACVGEVAEVVRRSPEAGVHRAGSKKSAVGRIPGE
jgi:hypothetical protein